jgi:hypothetical protein
MSGISRRKRGYHDRTPELPDDFVKAKTLLIEKGWAVFLTPILRCVDDTWTLRLRSDRLDHIFISETGEWSRKRFTREPFGDYTVCYQPKGEGKDFASLIASLG